MKYCSILLLVVIAMGLGACAVTTSERPYDGVYINGTARTVQPDEIVIYK